MVFSGVASECVKTGDGIAPSGAVIVFRFQGAVAKKGSMAVAGVAALP